MSTIITWLFHAGVTLRGNSGNRSGRRARRVSAGVSEDALATDSGVFEAWGRRWAEVHLTQCGAKEPPSGKGGNCSALCCHDRWQGGGDCQEGVDGVFFSATQGHYGGLLTAVLKSPGGQRGPTPKVKVSLTPGGLKECCWQLEFSLQLWRQFKQAEVGSKENLDQAWTHYGLRAICCLLMLMNTACQL